MRSDLPCVLSPCVVRVCVCACVCLFYKYINLTQKTTANFLSPVFPTSLDFTPRHFSYFFSDFTSFSFLTSLSLMTCPLLLLFLSMSAQLSRYISTYLLTYPAFISLPSSSTLDIFRQLSPSFRTVHPVCACVCAFVCF